jgi:thioredoxin 1
MSIVHITEDTFDSEVLKSPTPVLVDFWAEWCGPCKAIAPVLDQIATEYQGKLRIAKVDVDANQATAMRYNVRSIPMLLLFKNGSVEAQHVGLTSRDNLKKLLDAKL